MWKKEKSLIFNEVYKRGGGGDRDERGMGVDISGKSSFRMNFLSKNFPVLLRISVTGIKMRMANHFKTSYSTSCCMFLRG